MAQDNTKLEGLARLLAEADKTYASLPPNLKLEVQKVTRGLPEFGPRLLRRAGPGMEFYESRDFNPEIHERRHINARLSARAGRDIVTIKEAEIRQHVYFWRKGTQSMEYGSGEHTKKSAAEIMMIAMARHLARNEDMIGVMDGKGAWRGGNAHQNVVRHLYNVGILTGDEPELKRRLPRNSIGVVFDDGIMAQIGQEILTSKDSLARFEKKLDAMVRPDLDLYLVMVVDPQEIDFNFDGFSKFNGLAGDGTMDFNIAAEFREAYRKGAVDYIQKIQKSCADRKINFILHRTDDPYERAILSIYNRHHTPDMNPRPRGP